MKCGHARAGFRWVAVLVALVVVAGCGDSRDDAELDSLVVSDATLTPAFESDVFDYTAEVANAVASVTVTPTASESDATIEVNGTAVASGAPSAPIALTVGDNTLTVVVTTEDGDDTETYTVVVTRLPVPGSSPDLDALSLTVGELDQIFDPDITAYTASVGHFGASTRVIAEPVDEAAQIELNGETIEPGVPSPYVPLAPGDNTVEVVVTSGDGSTMRTYSAVVTRADLVSVQQQAYLKASNTGPDNFAAAVTLSRDTAVVGAPEEGSAASGVDGDEGDNSLLDPGAAYVFERSGATWMQTAYLKSSSPDDPDRFGDALALDGDLLLVGAWGEQSLATGIDGDDDDDSSTFVGAAYAFERDGMGVWSQTAYIKAANAGQGDEFGRYLDVDGSRAIIGAWSEDSSATGVDGAAGNDNLPASGAAYLFSRDDQGGWGQDAYLKASNTDTGDEFGRAVAIGNGAAAVGAPFEDSNATGVDGDQINDTLESAGAAYVFEMDGDGDWVQTAYIKASNTDAGDRFGESLDLDGDLLAVGAPGESSPAAGIGGAQDDDTLEGAGAVYVFERDAGGSWSQIAYVKASNPGFQDGFGSAVALQGNVLAVAARAENSAAVGLDGDQMDDSALNAGAVYVFERDENGVWSQLSYVKASNTDPADEFGAGLAFDGDTLISGAEFEAGAATGVDGDDGDNTLDDAGAAYVIR